MSDEQNKYGSTVEDTKEDEYKNQDVEIVEAFKECLQEARLSEIERIVKNDNNWRMYNGDIDWGKKAPEQARIHLNKAGLAVDQITAQMKKGIMNFDKWLVVENRPGYADPTGLITDTVAKRILMSYLDEAEVMLKVGDSMKNGVIESRSTVKITGREVPVQKYYNINGKQEMKWMLFLDVLPYKNYHTDPSQDLYEIHEENVDYYSLYQLSDDKPNKKKPYMKEKLECLKAEVRPVDVQDPKKPDESSSPKQGRRKPITVHEFWGTLLDRQGMIMQYKKKDGTIIPLENVLCTFANEKELIREPETNPRWSKRRPFITQNLIRVQGAKQPKAMIDAGVDLNRYMDELISLSVDGARKSVHGIKQVRMAWLADPTQAEDGMEPDTTLFLNELAPPNADALTTVETGQVPQEVFNVLGICGSSFAENVMQNEISLSGQLPDKAVKATEVSAAGASIQGIFDNFCADFETGFIVPLVEQAWCEILQNADKIDDDVLMAAFEGHEMIVYAEKYRKDVDPGKLQAVLIQEFKDLAKNKRFEYGADAFRFKGKGIRSIAASNQKMQQYMSLLSIAGQNPALMEQIQQGVSIPKLFKELVKTSGLDIEEIALTPQEMEREMMVQTIKEQIMMKAQVQQGQPAPQAAPSPEAGPAAVSPANATQIPDGMVSGNEGGSNV